MLFKVNYTQFVLFLVLPNSEALKMRIRKLGLERTSIGDFTGPPGLVYYTTESITWNDKREQP